MGISIRISVLAALLAGCGGGGGQTTLVSDPAGAVEITCAEVVNGTEPSCGQPPAASFNLISTAHAAMFVDGGTITRADAMTTSITVTNNTGQATSGYVEYYLNPGCQGEANWWGGTSNFTMDAGQSLTLGQSRQCAAMPLGEATFTAVAYEGGGMICTDAGCQMGGGTETDRATVSYVVTE